MTGPAATDPERGRTQRPGCVPSGTTGTGGTARRRPSLRPAPFTLFLLGLAGLGAALALARGLTHGPALHWDSVEYLGVARNLLAGDGFLHFDGSFYDLWPPLYPAALAAATLGVFDPLQVAGPLNALCFGLTVFVGGRFLVRRLHSPFLRVWAPVVLALALPLGEMAWWALSEPLFILLTTLALVRADGYLENRRTSSLLGAAAFTALAWQTRYLGIALAAAVGLLLLLFPGAPFRRRLRPAALFALVAGLPTALWLLRIGSVVGNRQSVDYDSGEILGDLAEGLSGWAEFDPSGWPLAAAALLLPAGGALLRGKAAGASSRFSWRPATVFGLFAVLYLGLLFVALMTGNTWHGVQWRFLVPVYIPLLVAGAVALDRLFLAAGGSRTAPTASGRDRFRGLLTPRRALGGLLALALSLWAGGQVGRTAAALSRATAADLFLPGGYSAEPWASSETLRHLRETPVPAAIYSNLTVPAYLHLGPSKSYYPLARPRPVGPASARQQAAAWSSRAREGAFVVWFRNWYSNRVFAFGPATLQVTPGLEPIADFPDGAIFEVRRGYQVPLPNPYRNAYDSIVSGGAGEPLARSVFDLYLGEDSLLLLREPCTGEDLRERFLLHYHPTAPESLPSHRRESGFENRDFPFDEFGVVLAADDRGIGGGGAKGVAILPLPRFEVARVVVGQWAEGRAATWQAGARLDFDRFRGAYEAIASGVRGAPAARGAFDLYLYPDRDRMTLAYLDETCAPEEAEARFFLHVYPASPEDLPPDPLAPGGRPRPFENRDFDFRDLGVRREGRCLALAPLPSWRIARIRTGQWVSGEGESWSADFAPPPGSANPAEPLDDPADDAADDATGRAVPEGPGRRDGRGMSGPAATDPGPARKPPPTGRPGTAGAGGAAPARPRFHRSPRPALAPRFARFGRWVSGEGESWSAEPVPPPEPPPRAGGPGESR